MSHDLEISSVNVFNACKNGGNPVPIVLDASKMSDQEMQDIARSYRHESCFVQSPDAGSDCHFKFRFWVPNHEMEMCGHATIGTTWLLAQQNRIAGDSIKIQTKSGVVEARITIGKEVEISQTRGVVCDLLHPHQNVEELLRILRITQEDLHLSLPVLNASTSRVKTLIPLRDVAVLDNLNPDFSCVKAFCEAIGSTGLYPFALETDPSAKNGKGDASEVLVVAARQFPKDSGYPEDPATGIAAAALAFGLVEMGLANAAEGEMLRVRQGVAMGKESEIQMKFDGGSDLRRCWVGGPVEVCRLEPKA